MTLRWLVILFFMFIGQWVQAEGEALAPGAHPITIEMSILPPAQISPGGESEIRLNLSIFENFFVYEDKIKLKILEPEETLQSELNIGPIVEFKDVVSKKIKRGLQKSGIVKSNIVFPANINPSLREIIVELEYVACTSEFCLLPKTLEARLPITVSRAKAQYNSKTSPSLRQSLTSEEGFKTLLGDHFLLALFGVFLFGILTSFTPCIYPLIPITMMVLGTNNDRPWPYRLSMSVLYVLGIAITYAALGVFAALSGGLFGSFAGHPIVLIIMSLIFLFMGLSLFGLFEIKTPGFLEKHLKKFEKTSGPLGTFISGCLSGVIAGPCVGPVLVGILAYIAHQRDPYLGFFLLFIFAMGFGFLFILLGTFINFQKRLPKSGPWMVFVKYFLGIVMIGFSIWYARPLFSQFNMGETINSSVGPKWAKYSEELIMKAQKEKKPVLIDFYADWCVACVELDKFTFSQEKVISELDDFILLKVDATKSTKDLREIQAKYEVFGLPTYIFISKSGKIIEEETLTGFEETEEFLKRIKRFRDLEKEKLVE